MVAGGCRATGLYDVAEIIDLETTKSKCPNFPVLPQAGYGACGTFVDNAHPIVCGGYDSITGCDKYIAFLIFSYSCVFVCPICQKS